MDFERRPGLKWCSFFRRIATMENEGHRSSAVLDRWEEEERYLSKWELCRVAKELRKFRHFRLTLDKDFREIKRERQANINIADGKKSSVILASEAAMMGIG